MIGNMIGQYRIVEAIGQGGMATVYKAYQSSFDRHVAIKVLSRMLSDDPTFVKRFQREAKVIARIEHRFIVPLYDYGEESGVYYIVMRLIEGGTLRRKMFYDKVDLPTTAHIIGQVAEALDFAHTRDVIHRDLKPSNILLDERGNAFLTDFGIAKMLGSSTQVTQSGVVGTPSYMSPEQCQGKTLGPPSDVYALGAILFEVLTGTVPYESDTPLSVMYMHVKDPIPSARALNSKLPAGIDKVFLRVLAKQPKDRYPNAVAMVKALREVAGLPEEQFSTPSKPGRKAGIALPSLPVFGRGAASKKVEPVAAVPDEAAPDEVEAPTIEAEHPVEAQEIEPEAIAAPVEDFSAYEPAYEPAYAPSDAPRPNTARVSQTVLFSILGGLALIGVVGLGIAGLSALSSGNGSLILPPPPVVITQTGEPVVTGGPTDTLPTPTVSVGGIIEPSATPPDTDTPALVIVPPDAATLIPAESPIPPTITLTFTPFVPTDTPIPLPTNTPVQPTNTAAPPSGRIAYTEGLNTAAEIMVMDTSGGGRQQLTSNDHYDGEPDWSPDGSRIAFEAIENDNTDIFTMAANGSDVRRLTTAPDVDRHPDWSPNGSLIAYETGNGDTSEIWVMNADGSNPVQQTANGYGDRAPHFSPDGTRIAYMTHQRGKWEIAIMAYPGAAPLALFSCPDPDCRFPVWSPDGTQIAFNTLDAQGTEKNIYVLTVSSGEVQLVESGGENGRPAWSSDGKFLFFNKALADISDIYRLHLASGETVRLTSTTTQAYGPDWGP